MHDNARNSYLVWKQNGKPRGYDTDMDMQTTRLRFKYYALRNYDSADAMRNRIERMISPDHCTVKTRQSIKDRSVPLATKLVMLLAMLV